MNTIILASNNAHKYREFIGIFAALDAPIKLLRPSDLGFGFDVVEDGTTFGENAMRKARGLYQLLNGILEPGVTATVPTSEIVSAVAQLQTFPCVLSDDSGICVHALDDAPGIRSARFGDDTDTPPQNDEERNDLLLRTLDGVTDRDAHYVCNAVLIQDGERYVQTEAVWHGDVLTKRIPGETGFGYDPIIWLAAYEASVAQIPQEQKDRVSHRAQAVGTVLRGVGII